MKLAQIVSNKKYATYGIAVLLVVGLGFVFSRNGKVKEQTMVIHSGDFVQQISVTGKVVAAQNADLGFSQSGRVARVFAKVGDMVTAGSLLAEIENGDLRAMVLQRQAALESQQAKLLSLQQGTRIEEVAVAQSAVDSSETALAQANQIVIDAIKDAYTKSDDAILDKTDQAFNNPNTSPQLAFLTNASQAARNSELERLGMQSILPEWQKENNALTIDDNVLSAASKAQKNLASVSALLADINSALSQATVSQTVTQVTISNYISSVAIARASINGAITSLSGAVSAQKNAAAALANAQKTLALEQAGATQANIEAQAAQVKAARADLGSAQAQLAKTIITAPFAGIVTKMDAKVGQIISPNIPEISLINSGAFQVESYVPEINISLIKVGNPATVTLDAYGSDTLFNVKVVSIEPAETFRDGSPTYKTVMQFDAQDERIKSGMTANVIVTTEKKSNVISVPQKIVISKDGQKFVQIKNGKNTVETKVETGSVSTLGQVEITSGLRDGDVLVLDQTQK